MKPIIRKIIFLLAVMIAVSGISFAVPSKDGKHPGPKEAVRPREVVQVYDAKTKTMRAIRKSGVIKIAVIPVNFVSAGPSNSGSYTLTNRNLLDMATNLAYLKNFYNEAAYGTVIASFTVVFSTFQQTSLQQVNGSEMCVTLSTPMAWYGAVNNYSVEGSNGGQDVLIQDAVSYTGVGSANFDTVIVLHAGYGNESTAGGSQTNPTNPGDIWSVQVEFGGSNPKANGFSYGIVVPSMEFPDQYNDPTYPSSEWTSPRGVCCHEFGHYLGLPDMYNTNSGNSVVGEWCLMDDGCWLNNGYSPNHPCVWCKNYLGLVNPQVITSNQQVSGIAPVETSPLNVYQFNVPNATSEYFTVCFTTTSAYNPYDPGTGVLIWHVDEGVINGETFTYRMTQNDINCYTPLTATLVTAGGAKIGDRYSYYGGPGDPWPGTKTTFAAPDSNSYGGYASGITISNFLLSPTAASFYAAVSNSTSRLAVSAASAACLSEPVQTVC